MRSLAQSEPCCKYSLYASIPETIICTRKQYRAFAVSNPSIPSPPLSRLCKHFMTPHNALPVFRPRYHSILVLVDSNQLIQRNTSHLNLLRRRWRRVRRLLNNEAHIRQRWYPHERASRCTLKDMDSRHVSVVTKLGFMLSEQVAYRDTVRRS